MIKPPGTPQKANFFFKKRNVLAIFNPKTLILRCVTHNNHRKLLVKTGWKIFEMIHCINMKTLPAKFYDNNLKRFNF